jgi:hypothetical protein
MKILSLKEGFLFDASINTWLIIRGRVWTADCLAKRGLPHNEPCVFCNSTEEDHKHLFFSCAVINLIWSKTYCGFVSHRLFQT